MRDDVRLLREAIRLIIESSGGSASAGPSKIYQDHKPSWWERLKSGITGEKSAAMAGKEREDNARSSAELRAAQIEFGKKQLGDLKVADLSADSWKNADFPQKLPKLFPSDVMNYNRVYVPKVLVDTGDPRLGSRAMPHEIRHMIDMALVDVMEENQSIKKFNDIVKNFKSETGVEFNNPFVAHDSVELIRKGGEGFNTLKAWVEHFIEVAEKEKRRQPGKARAAEKAEKRKAQEEREAANRARKSQARPQREEA